MFQRDQRNPTIHVLLIGGKNDHILYRTPMMTKELAVPSGYSKWERYVRTKEMRSMRAKDGTMSTYRVYEFDSEVKR